MKLLLDESIPRQIKAFFPESFELHTVQQMGWAGSKNGALLQQAAMHKFDAFVTADQGIEHQQNLEKLPIPVIVMAASRTRLQELQVLVPSVIDIVSGSLQKLVYRVTE